MEHPSVIYNSFVDLPFIIVEFTAYNNNNNNILD